MRYIIFIALFIFTTYSFGQGTAYQEGINAFEKKNFLKAFEYLKPFASSGDAMAEYIVGFCYLNPDLKFKNEVLGEQYLLQSANQLNSNAMQLLAMYYFQKNEKGNNSKIKALIWAEIAGAYNPIYNTTTARVLIRQYLNEQELKQAKATLKDKKAQFNKINLEDFYALNAQAKPANENSKKAVIPENTFNLPGNPYSDWVYRWKLEHFECDSIRYTNSVEPQIIDSVINKIKIIKTFETDVLFSGNGQKIFKISSVEQSYLLNELEKIKGNVWPSNMFPYSKCIKASDIKSELKNIEKMPTEKQKNMCSIVYTFSKPILLRNNSIALYLAQQWYRGNYTQLEFNFYKEVNHRWQSLAKVYTFYDSPKN